MAGARKRWSDMPHEILSQVADRLDLKDLFRFGSVCRDFHAASSGEISSKLPWFLSYGKTSGCSLLICNKSNGSHKIFTLKIPELEEVRRSRITVHGSSFGWLFVSKFFPPLHPSNRRPGILYFLHPFSRKRINLLVPWNVLQVENHVAAFSSPPPSHDCVLAIAGLVQLDDHPEHNSNGRGVVHCVQLNVFARCSSKPNNWEKVFTETYDRTVITTIKGGAYYGGNFYFFDGKKTVMLFDTKTHSVKFVNLFAFIPLPFLPPSPKAVFFTFSKRHVNMSGLRKMLGLDDSARISTCGTAVDNGTTVICSELTRGYSRIKGVWIRP